MHRAPESPLSAEFHNYGRGCNLHPNLVRFLEPPNVCVLAFKKTNMEAETVVLVTIVVDETFGRMLRKCLMRYEQ